MSLTLLLGGAASGKSALAVRLAKDWKGPVTLVATAEPLDEEMAAKITRHKQNRPSGWETIEEPLNLHDALSGITEQTFVIVDCLTLWLSNLMGQGLSDDLIESRSQEAAALAARRPGPTVVVSNEVGLGIVPANELARRFRNLLGLVNLQWASAAEKSVLMVAGLYITLEDPLKVLRNKNA